MLKELRPLSVKKKKKKKEEENFEQEN